MDAYNLKTIRTLGVALLIALLSAASGADDTASEGARTASSSPEFWLQPSIKGSSAGAGFSIAARMLSGGNSYTVDLSTYIECFAFCSPQERVRGDTVSVSLMRGSYTRSGRAVYGYEYGLAYVAQGENYDRGSFRAPGIPLKASVTLDGYVIGAGLSIELMLTREPYVAAGVTIPFGKLW